MLSHRDAVPSGFRGNFRPAGAPAIIAGKPARAGINPALLRARLHALRGGEARPAVGFDEGIQAWILLRLVRVHDGGDNAPDGGE